MKENLQKLLKKFHEVYLMNWIKGVNNDVSGIGLTFENLLDKKVDSDMFPDFYDIEIKCSSRFSGYPISLFNKTLDGPRLFELNYILEKYGNAYYENSDKKYLFVNLEHAKRVLVNGNYYFELFLSTRNDKMFIYIYNLDKELIDTSYIDLISIEEHLSLKLQNLAVIYASKRKKEDGNYFRYYCLKFYKLISVQRFYELIQMGIVKVSIICRASFSKNDIGKQKNKGINFKIDKDDVEKLFVKILEYNADEKTILINSEIIFKNNSILSLGDDFEKREYMAK